MFILEETYTNFTTSSYSVGDDFPTNMEFKGDDGIPAVKGMSLLLDEYRENFGRIFYVVCLPKKFFPFSEFQFHTQMQQTKRTSTREVSSSNLAFCMHFKRTSLNPEESDS